jgi:hypothetical protein
MSWVFDPKERRVARCIEGDHPQWYVLWGVYSRIYSAFPLFHSSPGTVLTARDARELVALIREAEIGFGPQRGPRIPGSRRQPAARPHDPRPGPSVPSEEELPEPYQGGLPEPYERDLPEPYERDLPEPYEHDLPWPYEQDLPEPYEPGISAAYEREAEASYEPGRPGDPESWPSGELAFLPAEPEIDWPDEGEAGAGAIRRIRRNRRYGAVRRGQW